MEGLKDRNDNLSPPPSINLSPPILMPDYCFLDLETTGFSPEKDSIIEVSFVRFKDGELISEVDKVCIPDKSPLNDFVSKLTGITQEEIDTEGVEFTTIAAEVAEKIGDSVIVGHNIDFDINFLIANGIPLENNPRLDTHELVRILLVGEESYALEVLCSKYGFIHESAHRAMSDVLASKKLFEFLLEKIEKLPSEFFDQVRPVLEGKTDWYAKTLFSGTGVERVKEREVEEKKDNEIGLIEQDRFEVLVPEKGERKFVRIGDNQKASELVDQLVVENPNEKFLLVTTKFDFYPNIKPFPTPEVLFDRERLGGFLDSREILNDAEATFYLKCVYRDVLGYRGKHFFDLFSFKERPMWDEVKITEASHPVFVEICESRKDYQVLSIAPYAFFAFQDLELFQDRVLIVDEGELFCENLLFSVSEEYSLQSYVESKEESVSVQGQFLVAEFCKTVIEVENQQKMSHFPVKVLLPEGATYPQMTERILALDKKLSGLAEMLTNPQDKLVRWVSYFPERGNLMVSAWHPDSWREKKESLNAFAQVWFHRHKITDDRNSFFKIFGSGGEGAQISNEVLTPVRDLVIPRNLTSASSPDFNQSCAQQILDVFQNSCPEKGQHLAVHISSLEAMRSIQEILGKSMNKSDFLIAEKVNGGAGKVRELLKQNLEKRGIFMFQRLSHPDMYLGNWQGLVVQKFPFAPPHPLFDKFEMSFKQAGNGMSFWDQWTNPQVAGNISRALSCIDAERVYWIDPRENTPWGKNMMARGINN